MSKINIFHASLDDFIAEKKLKKFIVNQIETWMWNFFEFNPLLYTNINKNIRDDLLNNFDWTLPKIQKEFKSTDESVKFLIQLYDHNYIESIVIPTKDRITLCISTQVGCKMGCKFCQTGLMGFIRNLSYAEILMQIILANKWILHHLNGKLKITNVVFMGMGEPLDNYKQVVQALKIMLNINYFNLSKHKVTISTVGITDNILELKKNLDIRLAISLHSVSEDVRNQLIPINKVYSLQKIKEILLQIPHDRYGITFEYILIKDLNDTIIDAKNLIKYLSGLKAKVNLIPMTNNPYLDIKASNKDDIEKFRDYLTMHSVYATIRYSRGSDIGGACGQMLPQMRKVLL